MGVGSALGQTAIHFPDPEVLMTERSALLQRFTEKGSSASEHQKIFRLLRVLTGHSADSRYD